MATIVGTSILITGAPGSGKSFLSGLFTDVINWDDYGSVVDGRWIIDIAKLPKGRPYYEGVADNYLDVIRSINPKVILFVLSDVETNRRVSKLRFDSDPLAPFGADWKERSNWTEVEFNNYQKRLIKEIRSVTKSEIVLVDNTPKNKRFWGLSVKWNTDPWHRFRK